MLAHWSCCILALGHRRERIKDDLYKYCHGHIDGLMWNCGGSSADALELLQPCAGPSASIRKLLYTYVAMLPWLY